MNIFKKIKLLRVYKKTVKKNRVELREKHNLKVDYIGRCYTALEVPDDILKTNKKYSEMNKKVIYDYIKSKMKDLTLEFKKYGLYELVHLSDVSQINPKNPKYYKVIVEYKYFSLKKYFKIKALSLLTISVIFLYFLCIFI